MMALRDKIRPDAPDGWLPLDQAAEVLGIARQTVLHKVQRGELNAVHVTGGRRKGLRIQVEHDQPGLFDTPHGKKGAVLTMTDQPGHQPQREDHPQPQPPTQPRVAGPAGTTAPLVAADRGLRSTVGMMQARCHTSTGRAVQQ